MYTGTSDGFHIVRKYNEDDNNPRQITHFGTAPLLLIDGILVLDLGRKDIL